jgi:hypothetical protein
MLTNAMKFKKNYEEAIEEVGMQIVEAISALEQAGDEDENQYWAQTCEKGSISIKELILSGTGEEVRYSNIDFNAVYDFLNIYSDGEICSNNNSVIEELEEVFDIIVDTDDIMLILDYDQEFLMEHSENYK